MIRHRSLSLVLAAAFGAASPVAAQTAANAPASKTLDIYVTDTEGGKATLYVSPSGETVLVDTGNPGERDLGRIMTVLTAAGVKQIDYLVSTHYHRDHIGGLQALAQRIPIRHDDSFLDVTTLFVTLGRSFDVRQVTTCAVLRFALAHCVQPQKPRAST